MWLSLRLFGVVEEHWLKNKTLIIVNSFLTGGKENGKQPLNFLLKEPFLIIMFIIRGTLMAEYNLANLLNGLIL